MTLTVDKDSETRRTYRPAHNKRNLVNFDAASRGLSPYRSIILSCKRKSTEYSNEDDDSRTTCTTLPENGNDASRNMEEDIFRVRTMIFNYVKNV